MKRPGALCRMLQCLLSALKVERARDAGGGEHVAWGRDRARVYHGVLAWTDVSVGAAFGVLLVPLLTGGLLLLDRGWVNAQLPARRRPR